MSWKEWLKLIIYTDRSHARTTTTVRDTKCLVQVKVANVCADVGRRSETYLGIHVCAIHVYQAPALVNRFTDAGDRFFKHTVGRWVGHHQTRKLVLVLLRFCDEVGDVDTSF